MSKPLLEIEPKEIKFIFQLKKQSTCSVQLTNNTYHHVAFKVKTTSPKKYSVRPNVGVLMPKSTCEFIVTMQAQRVAPVDMACKDKFLVQSTAVPAGTTDEDVTSSLFVKDDSRYVEENKLKVALISPLQSPELSPVNGDLKNKFSLEKDQIFSRDGILSSEPMVFKSAEQKMINEEIKLESEMEFKPDQDEQLNTVTNAGELKPEKEVKSYMVNDVEELKPEKDVKLNTVKDIVDEPQPEKDAGGYTMKDVEQLKPEKEAELKVSKVTVEELKLMEAIEGIKLKLNELESKLNEAELTISKLREERGLTELTISKLREESGLTELTISKLREERGLSNQEVKTLHEKLEYLSKRGARKVQVGFPLLYVCMVALICVLIGYHLRC